MNEFQGALNDVARADDYWSRFDVECRDCAYWTPWMVDGMAIKRGDCHAIDECTFADDSACDQFTRRI